MWQMSANALVINDDEQRVIKRNERKKEKRKPSETRDDGLKKCVNHLNVVNMVCVMRFFIAITLTTTVR